MEKFEEKEFEFEEEGNLLLEESNESEKSNINESNEEFLYLKKKIKRIELFSGISLVLIILLLLITINNITKNVPEAELSDSNTLPQSINTVVVKQIVKNIEERYNSQNIESLYDILGEYAQTHITLEDFTTTMDGIKVIGLIEDVSYSHVEFLGTENGAEWYNLHYLARYEAGKGNLKVSLRVVNDEWQVVGFRMDVDNLKSKD